MRLKGERFSKNAKLKIHREAAKSAKFLFLWLGTPPPRWPVPPTTKRLRGLRGFAVDLKTESLRYASGGFTYSKSAGIPLIPFAGGAIQLATWPRPINGDIRDF